MPLENHAPAYLTNWGAAYCGDSLDLLSGLPDSSINLVLTSPPFALQREKEYGNKAQTEYVAWLAQFARLVHLPPRRGFRLVEPVEAAESHRVGKQAQAPCEGRSQHGLVVWQDAVAQG